MKDNAIVNQNTVSDGVKASDSSTIFERIAGQKAALIEQIRKIPLVIVACQEANVGRTTCYRWLDEDPIFREQFEQARTEGKRDMNEVMESKLLKSANEGKLPAITFWLKHNSPNYSTRVEIVNSPESQKEPDLTPEQEGIIRQALGIAKDQTSSTEHAQEEPAKESVVEEHGTQ